jgi:O-antigen/teichoic acid export membrane protein
VKLFRDYAVLAGGQVASRLLGLLAFAWLARALDPEAYGAVEYVVGLSVLAGMFVDGGTNAVGVRRAAQDPGEVARLAFRILLTRFALTAAGLVTLVVLGLTTMKTVVPAALVWLFGVSLLPGPWRQEWLLQSTRRTASVALGQVIRAGTFAALVWMLVRGPRDLVEVGWAEIGATTLLTAYYLYVQHARITPLRVDGALRGIPQLVWQCATAGSASAVWALSQYAPLFLIGALVGGVQTAWFAAAARIAGSLLIFAHVYHYGLYPTVAHFVARKDGELAQLFAASGRVTAWGGTFVALALTLLAEPVVTLAMGSKLAASATMLKVMAWILPAALGLGHAYWALAASGEQAQMLASQSAGLVVTVVVALLLRGLPGGLGYPLGAVSGFLAVWIVAHSCAARRGHAPPPFVMMLKPALLAIVILAGVRVLNAGLWLSLFALFLYAAATPLADRKLAQALARLGAARAAAAR